ncbi:MAG: hypothetical protein ACD_20C00008G0002 [uncultured bacterium]|nr:MAG: hypothetical protein ACD_20C00008G0002 [uncultured bacterium]
MVFHPYPQVIQKVFSPNWFEPPLGFTRASLCSWIDHSVSGLLPRTKAPYSDSLSLRLRHFRLNLARKSNSLTHYAKGTRSHPKVLPPLVGNRFQVLLHSPNRGSFSPFPHGTGSLSVAKEYLALEDGPPRFPRDFSGLVVLGYRLRHFQVRVRGFHTLWRAFPDASPAYSWIAYVGPTTPDRRIYPVWALPSSLAATRGISFDFSSCRY